jgi:hypothetical protein
MLVWQACYKHHCKHMHYSPAAAVDERRSQVGCREEYMQRHTGRAMFSKTSNKDACNMKAQGHAAHMSTQDGVARLPGIVEVFEHAS